MASLICCLVVHPSSTSGFTGLERNLFDGSDVKRCWHQQSDQFTKAEQLTRGETRPNT